MTWENKTIKEAGKAVENQRRDYILDKLWPFALSLGKDCWFFDERITEDGGLVFRFAYENRPTVEITIKEIMAQESPDE